VLPAVTRIDTILVLYQEHHISSMTGTEAYSDGWRDYYCPDFDYLCEALRQSDPTVTRVLVPMSEYPHSIGHRLGTALRGNAIINEIRLHLGRFREDRLREYQKYSTDEAYAASQSEIEPLLAWLRSSPSLTTVKLDDWGEYNALGTGLVSLVLQELLQAMAENPFGIQSLVADTPFLPLSDWTEYLLETRSSSATRRLQSLSIYMTAQASDLELEAAAQAIGALVTLEVLLLRGNRLDPILRRLQETPLPLLRELTMRHIP
jgi:hypothetical protein